MMRPQRRFHARKASITSIFTFCAAAAASGSADAAEGSYAGSGTSLLGDHVRLRADIFGFEPQGETGQSGGERCAPEGSKLEITYETDTEYETIVLELSPSLTPPAFRSADAPAQDRCKGSTAVQRGVLYQVPKEKIRGTNVRIAGFTYGGLVVPFKYYLGGDERVTSSATIAPYLGYRLSGLHSLSLVPFVSAGLGMISVQGGDGEDTETKPSFSTSLGLLFRDAKNDGFTAGLVFGRDFLSAADRERDPTVDEWWTSIFLGYKIK